MIESWRDEWGTGFPFYYVQIAPFLYGDAHQKDQSQKLRNAQRYALKLPKTGMAVTLDIGKLKTAHPAHKQEVGNRFFYLRKIRSSAVLNCQAAKKDFIS